MLANTARRLTLHITIAVTSRMRHEDMYDSLDFTRLLQRLIHNEPPDLSVSSDLTFVCREQALKKRLALVHDSVNTALSDSTSHRRDNGEQIARLTQAHR